MKGNDILSVIFLALICIVISGLVYKLAPCNSGLIVPSFVLIAVSLWIAYDYIMLSRYNAKEKCHLDGHNIHVANNIIRDINVSSEKEKKPENLDDESEKEKKDNRLKKPKKESPKEFDIDMYNKQADIREIHGEMGFTGDTKLCNRMKYMGMQPKLSQDNRARWNARGLQPWIEEELREGEVKHWYESDFLEDQM